MLHRYWGEIDGRAFSVKLDGREHAAAVPFLDMVNHQPHALCFHTYQPATAQFELRSLGPPLELGAESIITYGSKANNARLVEQYGFIIPGNPFDRVPFPDPSTLGGLRISRDKVSHLATAMLELALRTFFCELLVEGNLSGTLL